MSRFYLTTTLPYVNAEPHIGFALEIIQADAIVRYRRLLGDDVFFNTGTDEHGLKIYRKAIESGRDPQAYCDEYAAKFRALATLLNLDNPTFIRTTDANHVAAAQEFWRRCAAHGDIYKKNYKIAYCVGCEMEKTDSELADGKCAIHPTTPIERLDEENYFFRFSKYRAALLEHYEKHPDFVVPENRQREISEFVKRGLEDFSISRLKAKLPWGVPVPGDAEHVMYVWFDALINYISTLGWPENNKNFKDFWGTTERQNAVQVAGKDNLRQQSAMWQAMLLSAGLPNSKQIFIHGFITSEGQKMSKSLGNVVDPYAIVGQYGVDAVRYYLLGALPSYEDGDFSVARFEEYYTAHLANGIGNLSSRILAMLERYVGGKIPAPVKGTKIFDVKKFWREYDAAMSRYAFDDLVKLVRGLAAAVDNRITIEQPWARVKKGEDISSLLYELAETLRHLGLALLPIMPLSGEKILAALDRSLGSLGPLEAESKWGGLPKNGIITKGEQLFPRV